MAAATEKSVKTDFARALSSRPGLYSFYATVRRLEQLTPTAPRVGSFAAVHPPVHFAQVPHLHFPPSELFDYAHKDNTLQVYFFGLFGPNGALPTAYTEYAHERSRHYYDFSMQRFADIFHDRLTAQFYRAGTRAEAAVSYDRAEDDPLSEAAAALSGMPVSGGEQPLPPTAAVAQAGRLSRRDNAKALLRVLEEYFGVPVQLNQHTPCFLDIPESARCCPGRQACTLGRDSLLGTRQRSISEQVQLIIGPISFARYQRFVPGSTGHSRLCAWLSSFSSRPLRWELHFRVRTDTIPPLALNASCVLGGTALFPDTNNNATTFTLAIYH